MCVLLATSAKQPWYTLKEAVLIFYRLGEICRIPKDVITGILRDCKFPNTQDAFVDKHRNSRCKCITHALKAITAVLSRVCSCARETGQSCRHLGHTEGKIFWMDGQGRYTLLSTESDHTMQGDRLTGPGEGKTKGGWMLWNDIKGDPLVSTDANEFLNLQLKYRQCHIDKTRSDGNYANHDPLRNVQYTSTYTMSHLPDDLCAAPWEFPPFCADLWNHHTVMKRRQASRLKILNSNNGCKAGSTTSL